VDILRGIDLEIPSGRMALELLVELNREQVATLVLVTPEAAVAQWAERSVLLHDGRSVA
jgi:predicted ABC-type transport system involved in lysophospholipase L1 biosynthesis ATPase subunit